MTTLQKAQKHLEQAQSYYERSEEGNGSPHHKKMSGDELFRADVAAQVAQAEALTRIADALDHTLEHALPVVMNDTVAVLMP